MIVLGGTVGEYLGRSRLGLAINLPMAVALAVTFAVTRIVLVASAEEEKHIARRLG